MRNIYAAYVKYANGLQWLSRRHTGKHKLKTATALIFQNVLKFVLKFLTYVKLICSTTYSVQFFLSRLLELVLIFTRMTQRVNLPEWIFCSTGLQHTVPINILDVYTYFILYPYTTSLKFFNPNQHKAHSILE